MRKLWIVLAIFAQVAVLASMVYGRESVVLGADRIYLRTAPIDPRDPFRGDYVRLRYPMNNVSNVPMQWSSTKYEPKRGDRIYAVLHKPSGDVHEVKYLTNKLPENERFIRGRINTRGGFSGINNQFNLARTSAKFGIEQMFVQQGSGIEIENKQGVRGGLQIPMEVEVALSDKGVAVLTDYRWGALAMELVFLPAQLTNSNSSAEQAVRYDVNGRVIATDTTLTVEVKNVSNEALVLNNPGADCGFSIVPTNVGNTTLRSSNQLCSETLARHLITLAPSQSYVLHVNLADPRWFVETDSEAAADIRTLDNRGLYRIVYSPPLAAIETESQNSGEPELWTGRLESRAFSGQGRID